MRELKNSDSFIPERNIFTRTGEVIEKKKIEDFLMNILGLEIIESGFDIQTWKISMNLVFQKEKRLNRRLDLPGLSLLLSSADVKNGVAIGKIVYDYNKDHKDHTLETPKCFFIAQLGMVEKKSYPSLFVPENLVEGLRTLDRPIKLLDMDEKRDDKSLSLIKSGDVPIFVYNPGNKNDRSIFTRKY